MGGIPTIPKWKVYGKTGLSRPRKGCILDFLPFYEFNRRRVPRSTLLWEIMKNGVGQNAFSVPNVLFVQEHKGCSETAGFLNP